MENLYNELAKSYFELKSKKEKYYKEIRDITAKVEELNGVLCDIENILTNYGTHNYECFIKDKKEEEK